MQQHTTAHLAHLTSADAHHAAWAPLDEDVDYYWTEEVVEHLKVASAALLEAAQAIAANDRRGRALQAVAARHGAVAAALMIPAAAAACARAASRIEDCSGMFGDLVVRKTAQTLLTIH